MASWACGVILVNYCFNLLMAPSHIPLWRLFSGILPPKPPRNILHFFLQLRFDGESESSASKHALHFWKFCCSHNITDRNTICMLFTLTFVVRVNCWCDTLSVASIHTWEQFMHEFFHDFENYDYDKLCEEILELRKNEDESL